MAASGIQTPASTVPATGLSRSLLALSLLIPVITACLLSWHSLGILDIWLHNQVGQDILNAQGFSGVNTYSYVEPDHPWMNHEWLFQVLTALSGPERAEPPAEGIQRWNVLRMGLTALLAVVLVLGDGNWSRLRGLVQTEPGRSWLALPLLMGMLLLWPRLLMRPELISSIIFVAMVRLADAPLDRWNPRHGFRDVVDPRRRLGGVFWLTVLWAQLHGFVSLAPIILILAGVARALESALWKPARTGPRPANRWWLAAIPLCLAGICLTPNGVQGLVYPLRALGQFSSSEVDLRQTISELTPLLRTRDSLGLTLLAYKLSLVWGLVWVVVTWGRTSLLRVFLWLLAAYAAYAGQRNIGFYAVTFMLLHTGTSGAPLLARLPFFRGPAPIPLLGSVAVLLALAAAVPWWMQISSDDFYLSEGVSRRFGSGANPGRYPEATARMLAGQPETRLFTNVDAAAYLLNRGAARLFIDGRTEAYSGGHWAAYERIKKADQQALALLEKYDPQRVFLSPSSGAFQGLARALLGSGRWDLVNQDESGFFLAPKGNRGAQNNSLGQVTDDASLARRLPSATGSPQGARAADLCLAWATVLDIGGFPRLQEQALRRGLEFRPDHPTLQHNLGNILLARGDFTEAYGLFSGALAVNGRLAGSALNAGVCRLKQGNPDEATELFRRATRINPDNFEAWANLGLAWLSTGDRTRAAEALEQALLLQPGNQQIQSLLLRARSGR
jgi:tetratricopeptide (TPR) repeat protein